ncbi:MAG: rRNA maturation RNase YbeY [Candidatus Pacebacteria bacterium]|nr:rRNA maturation RNase YbeY [Candidatus Paceibacterota bacterium]
MTCVDIRSFTRLTPPKHPYGKLAESVLPGFDISLVFAGETRARALNKSLRNKDYIPNVLSYLSGKKSGEIIICLTEARRQAPEYGLTYPQFVAYLFIHGLLHLKGLPHGTRMERYEEKLMASFLRVSLKH